MEKIEHLLPVQNQCGETPIWVPEEKALYWVDTGGRSVYRYAPAAGWLERFPVPLDSQALARKSAREWLLLSPYGVSVWDRQSNRCRFLGSPLRELKDQPHLQFCDCAVDPRGRLLAGTYNADKFDAPDGAYYRLDADGGFHEIERGIVFTNGIAFSLDGKTMYGAEMFARRILAWDYDPQAGTVRNRRMLAELEPDAGYPDGVIVDAEGFLWVGHWAGWRVSRYSPEGRVERTIRLPVPTATCMAFGGDDLDELYITTAYKGLSDDQRKAAPLSGDLFRIKLEVRGVVEPLFR
jgi:sugar lactone lactonase YvrE